MASVSEIVIKVVENLNISFMLNDKVISHNEAISEKGLLPAMARRADQIATLCLGYGIGISFDEADSSVLGVKVIFDNVTPESLRILCIVDVIIDIIDYSDDKQNISLDELLYD